DFLLTYSNTVNPTWSDAVSRAGNQMSLLDRCSHTVEPDLLLPEVYDVTDTARNLHVSQSKSERRINWLYGYAQMGYKNVLSLDLTGRNDWSSTLTISNNSYFYPSATLSAVISDMTTLPELFSFVKVRAAYAEVGNDTDPYSLSNVFNTEVAWGSIQAKSESSRLTNADLKPERTASYEVGTDIR